MKTASAESTVYPDLYHLFYVRKLFALVVVHDSNVLL